MTPVGLPEWIIMKMKPGLPIKKKMRTKIQKINMRMKNNLRKSISKKMKKRKKKRIIAISRTMKRKTKRWMRKQMKNMETMSPIQL